MPTMSFAPTPSLGTRDVGVLPTLLATLVLFVLLLGATAHLLALVAGG
jgi:hypothetical protein